MDHRILLNKYRHKKAVNTDSSVNVSLENGRKLLPIDDIVRNVSQYEQYEAERAESNKVRLTCAVNPLCSNVLFNRITEVVKNEGSDDAILVNYGNIDINDKPVGKNISFFTATTLKYFQTASNESSPDITPSATTETRDAETNTCLNVNAIRDTQLSDLGYVYHCGTDFMNNHLVRSLTFRNVNMIKGKSDADAFNTIGDMMRSYDGSYVIERASFPVSSGIKPRYQASHLYTDDNIMSFSESVDENIVEQHNGWFGFYNRARMRSYQWSGVEPESELRVYKPLMNEDDAGFVDMYPTRDLFSFVPKYNKARHRLEKNWNYCVTYPSSSTTVGFDNIFEQNNQSLRAIYFDENVLSDNGSPLLVIYSIAKHGLVRGDNVNIYVTDSEGETKLVVGRASVSLVADEYTFAVPSSVFISSEWVTTEEMDGSFGSAYTRSSDGSYYFEYPNLDKKYYVINGQVNIDPDAQRLSYKKVVGNMECTYYVRIFSKLPNFKFYSGYTGENDLYGYGSTAISDCQDINHAFDSQVSKLAFAKNIYGDGIGQVVFTDDIDTSNLKDNLGRPLTSIFLTLVKNNMGYKEWYGFDSKQIQWDGNEEVKSEFVEASHCFGKITCGLELSEDSRRYTGFSDIRKICIVGSADNGLDVSVINKDRKYLNSYGKESDNYRITDNEVWFNSDKHFYGDLACYDEYNAVETSLQPILHRFNTAQRESYDSASRSYFSQFAYDEISGDDFDSDKFSITTRFANNKNMYKEGYFYQPHYEIKIKSFGDLNTVMPDFLRIRSLQSIGDGLLRITTSTNHYLTMGDVAVIYDRETGKIYNCTTVSGKTDSSRTFTCRVTDEDGNIVLGIDEMLMADYGHERYKLVKTDNIPYHARMLRDGTCRYAWRDIYPNGLGGDDEEAYPFVNGALYIHKNVNLFLRRQDPDAENGLYSTDDIIGVEDTVINENNYIKEDEIEC